MSKKPIEPDDLRMPADEFDAIMRRALDAPPPFDEQEQDEAGRKPAKRPKAREKKTVEHA